MVTDNFSEKLTPAARQTLEEILSDYRDEILVSAAYEAARMTGEMREISVQDIVNGAQRMARKSRMPPRSAIDKILPLYAVLGILSSMAGFGIYALRQLANNIDASQQLPLVIVFVGVIMTAASIALIYLRKTGVLTPEFRDISRNEDNELFAKYLVTWRNIEVAMRNLASSKLGESVAQEPIAFLIERLQKKDVLSVDEARAFKKLLSTRNSVVHGEQSPATTELLKSLDQARTLLYRIQHAL
ncbi:hypothetical protein [Hyphomicrobium sp. MC8b]|uniref:hypothetical protein n=1 Tax=Hyphomicrobium sp. MC8b TaxID=300273 RepID=UPI00391C7336